MREVPAKYGSILVHTRDMPRFAPRGRTSSRQRNQSVAMASQLNIRAIDMLPNQKRREKHRQKNMAPLKIIILNTPAASLRICGTLCKTHTVPKFTHEVFAEEHSHKRPQDEEFEFVTQIACGTLHALACTAAGVVYAWGAGIRFARLYCVCCCCCCCCCCCF